jgi:hypothetical protein
LTESGDEYTGRAQVDFLDANWNVVFSTTSDVKGARLETPIPATLAAQPAERKGVWEDKVGRGAGVSEPPHLGLILSREDGTWSEDKGTPPSTTAKGVANEQYTPSYGRLVKTGDREYRLVFYYVLLKAGEFGFPTFAYLSSATKVRDQSFCSAHISAASRVISAGSKSVV